MMHNFSLIHDDMPCIDNDTMRRDVRLHGQNLGNVMRCWAVIIY